MDVNTVLAPKVKILLLVSTPNIRPLPESFTWKADEESAEFLNKVAPPTAIVTCVAVFVLNVRPLESFVPKTAVVPKLLPFCTKAVPVPSTNPQLLLLWIHNVPLSAGRWTV